MLSTFEILVSFRKEDNCIIITIKFQELDNIINYSKSYVKFHTWILCTIRSKLTDPKIVKEIGFLYLIHYIHDSSST